MANETMMTIVGNLTADPELRFTQTGVAVAGFTVASTPSRYNKQTGEWDDADTLFLRCTAWRDLAEHVCESLRKGHMVIVTGRLRATTWETKEGERRTGFDVDVDDVGPSLRHATARVARIARDDGSPAPATDPWAQPARTTDVPVPAAAGAGASQRTTVTDEPPF